MQTRPQLSAEYEKMLAEANQQPGVAAVMETMRVAALNQQTLKQLAPISAFRVTASTTSVATKVSY